MYFADVRGQRDILMAAIADAGNNGNVYSVWLPPSPGRFAATLSRKGLRDSNKLENSEKSMGCRSG
jgi:hypothetical protein